MSKILKRTIGALMTVGMVSSIGSSAFASNLTVNESNIVEKVAGNYKETEDKNWKYLVRSNGEVFLSEYLGKNKDAVMPDEIDGYKVTSVNDCAFQDAKVTLSSLTIGKNIKDLDGNNNKVFFTTNGSEQLAAIKNIYVAKGNTTFAAKDGVLYSYDMKKLLAVPSTKTECTIPDTVTEIDDSAFYECSELTKVTIGKGVKVIPERTFSECRKLQSVSIPDTVESIGPYAFDCCINLKAINISQKMKTIESSAFFGCMRLKDITISSGNKNFVKDSNGMLCTVNTDGTKNIVLATHDVYGEVKIPNDVSKINDYAFSYVAYNSIILNDKLKQIGKGAFEGCSNLKNIKGGTSSLALEENAFKGCKALKTLDISLASKYLSDASGTTVDLGLTIYGVLFYDAAGKNVLDSCNVVKGNSAVFDGVYPANFKGWDQDITKVAGSMKKVKATTGAVNDATNYSYKEVEGGIELLSYEGSSKKVNVPETINGKKVVSLNGTFKDNKTVEEITTPKTVETIIEAFVNCDSLTTLNLNEGITTLWTNSIKNCNNLKSLTLPNSIQTLAQFSICSCKSLESITLSNRLKSICAFSLSGCTSLKSITLPSSVEDVEGAAFSGLTGLKTFKILGNNNKLIIGGGNKSAIFGKDTVLETVEVPQRLIGNTNFGANINSVVFRDKDGKDISKQIVLDGNKANAPELPTIREFKFLGWDNSFDKVTEDIVVSPKYQQLKQFKVTFSDYNGMVISLQNIYEGESVEEPSQPKRDGYTFTGWDQDFSNITSDLIIYAQYEKKTKKPDVTDPPVAVTNKYTVTFVDYDGKVLDTQTVEEGKSASKIDDPLREGYTFVKWNTSFDAITKDTKVEAVYEKKEDLPLGDNKGTETPGESTKTPGESTGTPGESTSSGEETTLKKYIVKFVDELWNSIAPDQIVEEGKDAAVPTAPQKDGYTFVKWDGEVTNINKDTTVVAIYQKNEEQKPPTDGNNNQQNPPADGTGNQQNPVEGGTNKQETPGVGTGKQETPVKSGDARNISGLLSMALVGFAMSLLRKNKKNK